MSHIFANKIRLDGQEHVVGFVLREDDNGNRFYGHELTKIIDPDWLKPGPALQEGNVVHRAGPIGAFPPTGSYRAILQMKVLRGKGRLDTGPIGVMR